MDEPTPTNKTRRIVVLSVVLGLLFLAGGQKLFGSLAAQKKDSEKKSGARLPELVRTEIASASDHIERVVAYGRARPRRVTTVASELGARVAWVEPALEIGAALVREPDSPVATSPPALPVVVRLDTSDLDDRLLKIDEDLAVFDSQLEQLKTTRKSIADQLRVAIAEKSTAERELERISDLVNTGKLTKSEEDRQRLVVQARERGIVQLRGAIADNDSNRPVLEARRAARAHDKKQVQRDQGRAEIRPPHAGLVIERLVAIGDRVGPGAPLFRMIRGDHVEVVLQLPARLYTVLTTDTSLSLTDADTGAAIPDATIVRIAPRIDETQRTFEVFVSVPGTPTKPGVAPGTTVRAVVDARVTRNVIAVPRAAFLQSALYVVKPYEVEGDSEEVQAALAKGERFVRAERRIPEVKRWLLDVALIESGLEAGEEYVTSNLEAVAKDSRLRVGRPETKADAE